MTDQEWAFLETVARAAFANPFGETRDDLDLAIGGAPRGSSSEEILDSVLSRVATQLESLRRRGLADLQGQGGNRREVLRRFCLFHVFHRYVDHFDRLIQSQLQAGDKPCPVPFARQALEELAGFGLGEQEAERAFAVFYQLRRAFYFIKNGLVGASPSMKTLRRHLWDCVFTHDIRWFEAGLWDKMEEFSILLLGETGTGKGAAAAAIGRSGFIPYDPARKGFTESFTRNFVAINLSQYSQGVLESELFGHKKGSFTGAVENHEGLFSRCAPHGVIFLDEIGDVSIPVQIKLLQVLQERVFFPVGSHEPRRFSGRIVAATNRPLDEMLLDGKFRDDLYYRLCSDVVTIPPLRERLQEEPAELGHLIGAILRRIAGQPVSGREQQLVKKVLQRDLGRDYDWPGNVRELEQAVKRIILTGRYQGVKREKGRGDAADRLVSGLREGALNVEELLAAYCGLLYERFRTYEEVARRTQLDRRTAKKYVQMGEPERQN
ncbi:sigma 54-interacting transcriptional regulator [Geomonas sp. Red69]|uniref:Sigma 54-interacting transcriptional regulator n=1 Tax=Geomonas diazotrophica TaxID=2843197 RepID=A0ABX8JH66_9BACT|nr:MULTISPECIES: sigma 54-interacting transcriptional regulator [Geomonas]MBU5635210.1 sigma 54-interacting transcriptional regulator [Geomonas diazotrophica]QWV97730.1 sigma 54-interacting transcriptional regulator [Geomonas nitrogeniifigens]QXE86867.1 sigma 54-interacting transcriptional regulator [Geomonas nitrogeniifigens]